MSRVERASTTMYGDMIVSRKEANEVESTDESQDREPNQGNQYESLEHEEKEESKADSGDVQKAIDDLMNSEEFKSTGLGAEAYQTKDGISVKLTEANGSVIRSMTAEEFLKLRKTSGVEEKARGAFLDQKF